jgi:hypothetical protein
MDGWLGGSMSEEQASGYLDRQMDAWMNGRLDGQTDGHRYRWVGRWSRHGMCGVEGEIDE